MSTSKTADAKSRRRHRRADAQTDLVDLWGIHAVAAALKNPRRQIISLHLTKNAAQRLGDILAAPLPQYTDCNPKEIAKLIEGDAVHQGALLRVKPLPPLTLGEIPRGPLVVLDQVTDPHNVGAILRSAAAFGVKALVMTERNSPPLAGVLAKTASGGLEQVKIVLVSNLANALRSLAERHYQIIGFDGEGDTELKVISDFQSETTALVFGAEEKGLRRLTREHCDILCRISTAPDFSSLNVSNAAAISFHHFSAR